MTDLDTAIRGASGTVTGITFWALGDGRWQVSVRRDPAAGWRVEIDEDPIVAAHRALGTIGSPPPPDEDIFG